MAYLHKGPEPDGGFFYNVEQAVGATGVNNPADVRLVQYMIKHIFGAQAYGLTVDGWIGPVTITWIKKFQAEAKNCGMNVAQDGRIDRALAAISTVSKTVYAMLAMNRILRARNPEAYAQLPNAVPLNAVPKANPYNPALPKLKEVRMIRSVFQGDGWQRKFIYSDGTVETVFDPDPPITETGHGKKVSVQKNGNAVISYYEDGFRTVDLVPQTQTVGGG